MEKATKIVEQVHGCIRKYRDALSFIQPPADMEKEKSSY